MPLDDASTPILTIPSWSDSTAQTASGSVATLASRSRLPSASTIQILVSSSETSSPTCKSIARSPDLRRRPRPQIYRPSPSPSPPLPRPRPITRPLRPTYPTPAPPHRPPPLLAPPKFAPTLPRPLLLPPTPSHETTSHP